MKKTSTARTVLRAAATTTTATIAQRSARRVLRQPALARLSSTFRGGPAPPRLPPALQAEFERLQRVANTQEGFNPESTPASLHDPVHELAPAPAADPVTLAAAAAADGTTEDAGLPSQPLRKGAPPEFEGDVNPRTGEVGGPKNEPLRWGANGDYSFNGRVTDF